MYYRKIIIVCCIFLSSLCRIAYSTEIEKKISPAVRSNIESYFRLPVIILCSTQILDNSFTFEKFCIENSDKKRSELKKVLISQLFRIAEEEQKKILPYISSSANAVRLWIVNAIGATEIRRLIGSEVFLRLDRAFFLKKYPHRHKKSPLEVLYSHLNTLSCS